MTELHYEELSHTADISIRVSGRTLNELFENAAFGMFDIISGRQLARVPAEVQESLTLESFDRESLLVDWLTELLLWYEATHKMVTQTEVQAISDTELSAYFRAGTVPFEPYTDIKAVTYHELAIEKVDETWRATIVFDV